MKKALCTEVFLDHDDCRLGCRSCDRFFRSMSGTCRTLFRLSKYSPMLVRAQQLLFPIIAHLRVLREANFTLPPFADNSSFSSPEVKEKKSSEAKSTHKSNKDHIGDVDHVSETDDSDKSIEDSDSDSESLKASKKSSTSSLLTWVKTSHSAPSSSSTSSFSSSTKKTSTSSAQKPSSSSAAQTASTFASSTSIAKNQAAESKRKARASDERVSSEDENDNEDVLSSEFEDSGDELDSGGGMTELKNEIVTFFQTASIDELSLISGCSVKKAQRIVELRPFDSWQSLVSESVAPSLNAVAFNMSGIVQGTTNNLDLLIKSLILMIEVKEKFVSS